jgi:small subunit ribosomal protein S1
VVDSYGEDDVVEGRVAKVVTFGAFVEILPGVEGLVHISELAAHHVENPREVVSQGDAVNVRILEIDGERRRLSLSLKRVEEGDQPVPRADGAESVHTMPELRLSEEAFPTSGAATIESDEALVDETVAEEVAEEVVAEEVAEEIVAEEIVAEEIVAEEIADEIVAEVELEEVEIDEAEVEVADELTEEQAAEAGSQQSDAD